MKNSQIKISIDELLKGITYKCKSPIRESIIRGISIDSRNVTKDYLFFAVNGFSQNGNSFITQALDNGASIVLSDEKHNNDKIIFIPNLRWHIGNIASRFYGNPSKELETFVVTGTNGKTTCVEIISQIGKFLGKRTGYISTIGSFYDGKHLESGSSSLTTPGPLELQRTLREMKDQEVELVAIEASSHGLDQFRLNGVDVDVGILTSFSHDHLDYHKEMECYAGAKLKLFTELSPKLAILNEQAIKEPIFNKEMKRLNWPSKNTKTKVIFLDANRMEYDSQGKIKVLNETGEFSLDTISKSLALNVKCALSAFENKDYHLSKVNHLLHTLKFPKGRMEEIELSPKDRCYVDYAHTPHALSVSLESLKEAFSTINVNSFKNRKREISNPDIWCIFGCGGNRDKEKRPLMAEIAEAKADHVIVTNDNPRKESEHKIVEDIISGFKSNNSFKVILDRRKAINYCLDKIDKNNKSNLLLIAGKGHEEYQEVGDKKIPFSDKGIVEFFKSNS